MTGKSRTPSGSLAKLMAVKGGVRAGSNQNNKNSNKFKMGSQLPSSDTENDNDEMGSIEPVKPPSEMGSKTYVTNGATGFEIGSNTDSENLSQMGSNLHLETFSTLTYEMGSKEVQEIGSNGSEIGSHKAQNGFDGDFEIGSKIGSKIGSTPISEPISKLTELCPNPNHVKRLAGNQKAVFLKLYASCVGSEDRTTFPLQVSIMANEIKISVDSVRTILKRAEKSFLIHRLPGKRGIGGFSQFQLSELLFTAAQKIAAEMGSKMGSEMGSTRARSSSELYKETSENNNPMPQTTTTRPNLTSLNWINDIEIPAAAAEFITHAHLRQLARAGFTENELPILQQSVDNLSVCLEEGASFKAGPTAAFMGVMRKDGFFSAPHNFKFNRARALRMLESDEENFKKAVEIEINRIALEQIGNEQASNASLDDIPF